MAADALSPSSQHDRQVLDFNENEFQQRHKVQLHIKASYKIQEIKC